MSTAIALDSLQAETLREAYRFRIAVAEEFEQLPVFSDAPCQAVEVLDALATEHEYLEPIPLYGDRVCYKLAARFSRDFACDFDSSRPLKERDKIKAYSMLRFCVSDSDTRRQALTAIDFDQHFPQFFTEPVAKNRPLYRNYYLSPPKLGVLRIDHGGEGHWKRILTAIQRDLQKHRSIPAYQKLIEDDGFELAVVTMFESKAKRIRDELTDQLLLQRVPLRVLAVPELLNLISPPPLDSL